MGPSGSGKSTLMNIVGCLDTPSRGTYVLRGKMVSQMNDDELAAVRNREIGFVFQTFNLLPRATALHNVELPLVYAGVPKEERLAVARRALDMVDLGSRVSHRPSELSGGQRQRVAIARALVMQPSILLADEPTGNLDSQTGEEIMRLFERLHTEGNTIILVTHEADIAAHAHRTLRIRDGQIESDDPEVAMPFSEAITIALQSLRANKLRSFLTVLGILIGVSSVIAVVAITDGLDRYMSDKVLELGTRSFTVDRMPAIITSHDQWAAMNKRKNIEMLDVAWVRRTCDLCAEVGAQLSRGSSAKYGRVKQNNVQITGITENIPRIGSVRDLATGRHLIQADIDQARPVAVIGTDLVDAFFGTREPIGREVLLDGRPFKVVGVAEKKGTVFGESQDNFAWIPITSFRKMYGSRRSITISVEARDMEVFEAAQDQVRVALRARRHLDYGKADDFEIETGQSVMDLWQNATRGIYVVTIVVTAIALLVGGIVVMNIMLVSVTERIREIGVRKALGARRRDILRQFLVESVILSAVGGLLGILGATTFSLGLAAILGSIMSADFSAPVRLWAVLLALFVSTAVGLAAGIYPASRAAALDPVTALRSE